MTAELRAVQPGLAAALAAVQREIPPVAKTKTADVRNKENKFLYSYKYADLADVNAAILPLLGKNGLAFACAPTTREKTGPLGGKSYEFGLEYQLLHETGEVIDGFWPIDFSLPIQQIGGIITYARRYILCALTGVSAEEDTDAAVVSAAQLKARRERADAAADRERNPRGKPPVRPAEELPRNADGSVSRGKATNAELAAGGNMTDKQQAAHNKLEREVLGVDSDGKLREPPQHAPASAAGPFGGIPGDPPPLAPVRAPRTASGNVAGMIVMHFERIGITDRDVRLGMESLFTGRSIMSTNDLTADEGYRLKRVLEQCKNDDADALHVALDKAVKARASS